MKGFLQDKEGNYSSTRLSFLICMFLSTVLIVGGVIGLFMGLDITSTFSTAVALATIGTAGKNIQNMQEKK